MDLVGLYNPIDTVILEGLLCSFRVHVSDNEVHDPTLRVSGIGWEVVELKQLEASQEPLSRVHHITDSMLYDPV